MTHLTVPSSLSKIGQLERAKAARSTELQMYVYVFEGAEGLVGFAAHADGLNLPVKSGSWTLVNRLIMAESDGDRPIIRTLECLEDLRTYGFHITLGGRRVTDQFKL